MTKPLTPEERESFRDYATDNYTASDGSLCQWADYTIRLLADLERCESVLDGLMESCRKYRAKLERAESERDEAQAKLVRIAGMLDALAAAQCMGELLGEECGWCPACQSKVALAIAKGEQ